MADILLMQMLDVLAQTKPLLHSLHWANGFFKETPMVCRIVGIQLILALLLTGKASAQEKKLEPLIVSYSSFTGNRAPLWIGKDLGL